LIKKYWEKRYKLSFIGQKFLKGKSLFENVYKLE
jgi:hypothetical protein